VMLRRTLSAPPFGAVSLKPRGGTMPAKPASRKPARAFRPPGRMRETIAALARGEPVNCWRVSRDHLCAALRSEHCHGPKSTSPRGPAQPSSMQQVSEAHGFGDGTPARYRAGPCPVFSMRGL
jgi:hypothetical protein